ncbi:hypothetical protein HOLleu_29526 [Holothuria leucospilota]|uniref:Uncharacterized protein n=1 Tax=Holothuria leucospilota TaxID=206669 RepID=A0A9Q1BNK4_HOLLE|nr:hypothetical protein HOLleu_29526 [Holothuria leucospilota]
MPKLNLLKNTLVMRFLSWMFSSHLKAGNYLLPSIRNLQTPTLIFDTKASTHTTSNLL